MACMACGGGPAPKPEPVAGAVTWTAAHGGAWVATCPVEGGFVALRAGALDRWSVPAEGPLKPAQSVPLPWPGSGAPGVALSCADGIAVRRADGSAVALDGDGWRPAGATGAHSDPAWSGAIDGRALRIDRGGWTLLRRGVGVAGRYTAGDFADATWDGYGGVLWAVGPTGLWRWTPDTARLTFVSLPDNAHRSLMRVWRDGPFVWVVDDSGTGYALDLSSGMSRLARRPGPVRLTGPERMALIGGRRVSVVLGEAALEVDGQVFPVEQRVDAFTPLGGAEVLLGVGDAIERWRVAGAPQRVERWVVGDRTRRIIVAGSRVFAVGGYGLLLGTAELPDRPPRPTNIGAVVVE